MKRILLLISITFIVIIVGREYYNQAYRDGQKDVMINIYKMQVDCGRSLTLNEITEDGFNMSCN